jgi:long-chain-fatty-acid--CoA ligase ACSBG
MGLQRHDSVNIWGFNAPEWCIAAHAAIWAGGKVAGLYPTDTDESAAYKVVHSGGSIVVVEDKAKVGKLTEALNARGDCKRLKAFVAWGFEPEANEKVDVKGCGSVPLVSWKALMDMGKSVPQADLDKRVNAVEPGNCAALIYTSGTTGEPKAVMISHDNIIFESCCVIGLVGESCGFLNSAEQERILSYLPLSHVAGFMVDICCPMIGAAMKPAWCTTYFARPYDLKAGAIKDRLQAAQPTIFIGVPLVWEKIADKIRAIGAANTGAKKALGDWAKGVALEHAKNCQMGGSGGYATGHTIAMSLLGAVKSNLGLSQLKFGFTGAAPIRVDTLEYFGSLGIGINEVYGMSECTGACTWSLDEAHLWGSCGFEMPGVEVCAFKVDDRDLNKKVACPRSPALDALDDQYQGELCFRGRNIMMGYLANPDLGDAHVKEIEKKTAEAIDREGWLHSGDKGMITTTGMVKITGRYKELIIGDGGENIAPVPIEDHVKKSCDGIAEVMMVGDKRKYNVALVTLKAVGANGEVPGTDDLDAGAKRVNPEVTTISGAMKDSVWIEAISAAIKSANDNGKVCPNNAFKIQKFTILPQNFSEENNELTPTKKLKRAVVATKYTELIEKLYSSDGMYIPYQ